MIYYFSGACSMELVVKYNMNKLFSQFNERKDIREWIAYKKEHPEFTGKLMVDSGAFSSYNRGIPMDVEDYLKFINEEIGEYATVFVAVDDIPNPMNVDADAARRTWENYLYMYNNIKEEYRDKLIPVFHYGESFNWLDNMLEYTHPNGKHLDYIGLAISLESTPPIRIKWGQECLRKIASSSNPNVKTHAFGVGVKRVLEHINVTSTDATTWLKRAAFGEVAISDNPIPITERRLNSPKHIDNVDGLTSSLLYDTIKDRGWDIEELREDGDLRREFNIEDTNIWLDELSIKSLSKGSKVSLW